MAVRKAIGGAMVATPFIAVLALGVHLHGWGPILFVVGFVAIVVGLIFGGVTLLMED